MPRALAPLLALALALPTHAAVGDEKPFPIGKTVDLKEPGQVYTVEGRQYVPKNVKITGLRHCVIRGKGDNATLVFDGPLKLKAVTGGSIRFENVWLEVGPKCKEITLSNVEFTGQAGMRTPEDSASRAKMFIVACKWIGRAQFDVSALDGKIELQNCHFDSPVKITGAPRSEKAGSNAVVQLEACHAEDRGQPRGMLGGLMAFGVKDLLVRNCDLAGQLTSFTNCLKLDLDGSNLRSKETKLTQSKYGGFKNTEIHNCDFRTQLIFQSPADGTKAERVMLDHSWFRGEMEPDAIASAMILDQRKDATIGVLCTFAKVCPVPLKLGGRFE